MTAPQEQQNGQNPPDDRYATLAVEDIEEPNEEGSLITDTSFGPASLDGEHTHSAAALVAPESSRASRPRSFKLADFPVPNGREEEWRFAPLKDLAPLLADSFPGVGVSVESEVAEGASIRRVPMSDVAVGRAGIPEDRGSAAAWNNASEAVVVEIPDEVETPGQTHLTVRGTSLDPTAQHLVISAGHHARGIVVIDHVGSALLGQNVEINVGDGANLTVVSIQDWADDAVHMSTHYSSLGRDSSLKHVAITLGGKSVRLNPSTSFSGPGSDVEKLGLYFADSGQHLEHRLFVDHAVPNCTSRVTYKGALQGASARTVWVGDVLIRAAAEGTDTYELNRNLVLTEGARADSVPNLEIETGEIAGAGHASATGRFDDEQLFYLRSRGIPEDLARQLVVRGFFAELIQKIGVPEIQERLLLAIEQELAKTMSYA